MDKELDTELSRVERMVFGLLRASLNGRIMEEEVELFRGASREEWDECYRMAARHGVKAVAWDGVMMLPEDLRGYDDLRIVWGLDVEGYEDVYRRYCEVASELTELYRQQGIGTVVLKGVGFSTYYPTPSHREGGDIDIYTYSLDRSAMSDAEANELADEVMRRMGIVVDVEHCEKHSEFVYKDISIENHKRFLATEIIDDLERTDEYLHRVLAPEEVTLEGGYKVMVPSEAFNRLFMAYHASQHFADGLVIHHLYDWACTLRRCGGDILEGVMNEKIVGFVQALTELSNGLLGTKVPVMADRDLTKMVMEEMMHPKYPLEKRPRQRLSSFIFMTRRFVYKYRMRKRIHEISYWKVIWRAGRRMLR